MSLFRTAKIPGARNFLAILCLGLFAPWAHGQEYQPPSSPELYKAKESEQTYIKSTPELYESNGPRGVPLKFPSGLYLGFGLGFGQSRSAGGSGNPIPAYSGGGEIGYIAGTGSWSRFEAALEILTGKVGHSRADMPLNFGILAKIGHGYSLGDKFFGVWRLGAGMVQADYSAKLANGIKVRSPDAVLGTALQLSYIIAMPVTNTVSVTGGFEWTNLSFNVGSVIEESSTGNRQIDIDENVVINVPKILIGIRLGL